MSAVPGMRKTEIEDREWIRHMFAVPQSHALGARQHGDRRLRVQYGVHGTGRDRMLGMWGGGVQAREWVRRMLGMLAREVLDRDGRDVGGDVRGLSDAYVLWGGERDACQLHMQQGLYGGGRYGLYGMRAGQLQRCQRFFRLYLVPARKVQ